MAAESWAAALALLAIDPAGLGGAVLRGPGGPGPEAFIAGIRRLLPERRMFRLPPHIGADRLAGSLYVAETLRTGKPCLDPGLLAEARGGVLLIASGERLTPSKAGFIAAAVDERPGEYLLIVCDEGQDDERAPPALAERAAFLLDLPEDFDETLTAWQDLAAARALLPNVVLPDVITAALCGAALSLGINSLRPALFACAAARATAALDGRREVSQDDATAAVRLVLAPRALRFPVPEAAAEPETPPPPPASDENDANKSDGNPSAREMSELLLAAVKASLPQGLLAALEQNLRQSQAKSGAGAASEKLGVTRGRPAGTRAGEPRNGARLALVDTLRAAAPWQPLRRRAAPGRQGLIVTSTDLRIRRYQQKRETTAIFVVDASGSAAVHRMAEAKGAVELLLADCYVRRDRTALIAFRGKAAEVLLPPTRSLQRARKSLADLPGGGGTPLAAGIAQAVEVATQVRRAGGTPLAVFLTDGKANIARDGAASRPAALADAEAAARMLRLAGVRALMIDLADARGGPAQRVAEAMAAQYLALPRADAASISRAVAAAMPTDA
ncbi:MAG: magnesium chelatase subunit D [Aestuariivirga sp.]|uniref:magnesium chelatase subunit D n=1 Tax=Aestuariivirga sp. TaxID=2650926 RepID=UPI0038D07B18